MASLILIEPQHEQSDTTVETHAERLQKRDIVETVATGRYEYGREGVTLMGDCNYYDSKRVYVVPMITAHTNVTKRAIPSAVAPITDSPIFTAPIGRSPTITDAIFDRATNTVKPSGNASLILVGLGSSSLPYQEQMLQYHRERLIKQTAYDEVTTSYLLQDPAVECARYTVTNERAVAVPVFVSPSAATREEIPQKLGVGCDGIQYTDPLGTHPRVTDAIQAKVAEQRVIQDRQVDEDTFSTELRRTSSYRPMATDSRGPFQ